MLKGFLTLLLVMFGGAFVLTCVFSGKFRRDVNATFRQAWRKVKDFFADAEDYDYDCDDDDDYDDDDYDDDDYDDEEDEEFECDCCCECMNDECEEMNDEMTNSKLDLLDGLWSRYLNIKDRLLTALQCCEERNGYGQVVMATRRVIAETEECIELHSIGRKFAAAHIEDTMATDALILILENVNPALELVGDHLNRAPYSVENSGAVVKRLEAIEGKIGVLKDAMGVIIKKLVYRPLDEDNSSFEAGFEDLKEKNRAKIKELEEQIKEAQAIIKNAEAAIRDFEQLGRTLSGNGTKAPEEPDEPETSKAPDDSDDVDETEE